MSLLLNFPAPSQESLMKHAYKCLKRIQKSSRKCSKISWISAHCLVEDILIELFLPEETMHGRNYPNVEWKKALEISDKMIKNEDTDMARIISEKVKQELMTMMKDSEE